MEDNQTFLRSSSPPPNQNDNCSASSSSGGGGGGNEEILLDTQETCFLCLKDTTIIKSESTNEDEGEKGLSEVNFRNISRYLNIDSSTVLENGLKEDKGEEEMVPIKKSKCDFSVKLCSNCSALSIKLSELIRQKEVLDMLVKDRLQEFHHTLISSENEISPSPEGRIGQKWRHEAKKKCAAKFNRLDTINCPKVRLKSLKTLTEQRLMPPPRLPPPLMKINSKSSASPVCKITNVRSINPPSSPPPTKTTARKRTSSAIRYPPTNFHVPMPPEPLDEPEVEVYFESEASPPSSPEPEPEPEPEPPSNLYTFHNKDQLMVIDICKKHTKVQPGNRRRCSICSLIFLSSAVTQIQLHIVNSHPEKFFVLNNEFKNLSEEMVNQVCKDFLGTESAHAKEKKTHQNSRLYFWCAYCDFGNKSVYQFKYHLVYEHYRLIKEKLIRQYQTSSEGTSEQNTTPNWASSYAVVEEDEVQILPKPEENDGHGHHHRHEGLDFVDESSMDGVTGNGIDSLDNPSSVQQMEEDGQQGKQDSSCYVTSFSSEHFLLPLATDLNANAAAQTESILPDL